VYLRYVGYGDIVAELERNLRLLDAVMRFQTIVLADKIDARTVSVDAAEVQFEAIVQSDDEPELTFAQRLGLEERSRRDDRELDVPEDDADEADEAPRGEADDNEDEEA
jgi:small subunit ribosomal protein S6